MLSILARIVTVITVAVFLLIAAGVALYVLDANEESALVSAILRSASFIVTPFRYIFELDDNNAQVAINWGIAAVVYIIIGRLITTLLSRGRHT